MSPRTCKCGDCRDDRRVSRQLELINADLDQLRSLAYEHATARVELKPTPLTYHEWRDVFDAFLDGQLP